LIETGQSARSCCLSARASAASSRAVRRLVSHRSGSPRPTVASRRRGGQQAARGAEPEASIAPEISDALDEQEQPGLTAPLLGCSTAQGRHDPGVLRRTIAASGLPLLKEAVARRHRSSSSISIAPSSTFECFSMAVAKQERSPWTRRHPAKVDDPVAARRRRTRAGARSRRRRRSDRLAFRSLRPSPLAGDWRRAVSQGA
jgi:hypothetical protein